MSLDSEEQPDLYAAEVVDEDHSGAIVSINRIKARDLNDTHAGKFLGTYNPDIGAVGANVPAKILKVRHFNDGKAPGVSVWYRMSQLPDGTPAKDDRMHLPFDTELELVDMIPFKE
ncbi:hypothetical protein MAUB1S_01455 [Mycolicibacterium aubagnense]